MSPQTIDHVKADQFDSERCKVTLFNEPGCRISLLKFCSKELSSNWFSFRIVRGILTKDKGKETCFQILLLMTCCLSWGRKSCVFHVCLLAHAAGSHRLLLLLYRWDGTVPPVCVSALPIGGASNMSYRSHAMSYMVTWFIHMMSAPWHCYRVKLCQLSHKSHQLALPNW